MAKRQDIIEAVLFLPAMALLAVALFCVFWLVMKAGHLALLTWAWLLSATGLPRPAALALAVIAAAVTVYAVVDRAVNGRRRPR